MPVCIYCKKTKTESEFSDEHVFSRAFCGQGENWTLPSMVCEECNGIFSACESHWAHTAVESMMRNFQGPLGRNENERRRRQPIEVPELYQMTRGESLAYDAGFSYPNTPYLRPQLVEWPPGHISVTSDLTAFQEFNNQLDAMIRAKELYVTQAASKKSKHRYEVTRIILDQQGFKIMETSPAKESRGIWLRVLPDNHTIESKLLKETHRVTRRLVLDDRDRMYARAASPADVANLLNHFMNTEADSTPRVKPKAEDQEYKISLVMAKPKVFRCALKTGVNLLAHVKGFDFVMRSEFDVVCGELVGKGDKVDTAIMGRCWILGEGPRGQADLSGFQPKAGIDKHELVVDVDNSQVRFRLRLYGSLAYVGYLGQVVPSVAAGIGTIRAEVDFMGDGIRLI